MLFSAELTSKLRSSRPLAHHPLVGPTLNGMGTRLGDVEDCRRGDRRVAWTVEDWRLDYRRSSSGDSRAATIVVDVVGNRRGLLYNRKLMTIDYRNVSSYIVDENILYMLRICATYARPAYGEFGVNIFRMYCQKYQHKQGKYIMNKLWSYFVHDRYKLSI